MTAIKVVGLEPPNLERLKAAGFSGKEMVITYGDTIYVPDGKVELVYPHILVHERVHMEQQERQGAPEAWWEKWLTDYDFRLQQELEAYKVQYVFLVKTAGPNARVKRAALEYVVHALTDPTHYHFKLLPGQVRRIMRASVR